MLRASLKGAMPAVVSSEVDPAAVGAFRSAGRTLFSLGLVRGAEGNLSTFDGATLLITRTGSSLGDIGAGDVLRGGLDGPLSGASSDVEVHRSLYRQHGRGAVVHTHSPGTVPEGRAKPGEHGVYVFAVSLSEGVAEAVRRTRVHGGAVSALPPGDLAVRPIQWRDGAVRILDQRRLPAEERFIDAAGPEAVAEAIRSLAVRGAPLLGIAAAYGVAAAAVGSNAAQPPAILRELVAAGELLVGARPTAANVAWAVRRVLDAGGRCGSEGVEAVRRAVVHEAVQIALEDDRSCRSIGEFGSSLVPDGANVLTHCNTGALATGGSGTAQGVIVAAHRMGKRLHVWVDETRPLLQGARLTAWELRRLGIPMTLVVDGAAGSLMAKGLVDLVVVGADRIAANGDVANKIGTYPLAVLAGHHGVPFFVAAPLSTVDLGTATGESIAIEQRDPGEVTGPFGETVAPRGTAAANPAFDVTPAELIAAIITDRGVATPPYRDSLLRLQAGGSVSPAGPAEAAV